MVKKLKLKYIIAVFAILSVIIIPAYAVYNEQYRNWPVEATEEVAEAEPVTVERVDEPVIIVDEPEQPPLQPQPTATPVRRMPGNIPRQREVVEIIEPKWVPETPVTDQKLFRDNLVAEGSTNVLIMGRDRNQLDDTMGVVSIDTKGKEIRLIMFPRDTFIQYTDEVLEAVKKAKFEREPGYYKLNNIVKVGEVADKFIEGVIYNRNKFKAPSFDFLCQVIYEKFDIEIDDYVRINTRGFVQLVDMFGYVTVYVPTRMRYYDPVQGLNIDLQKGTQRLNGKQAEGFVRFRQGSFNDQGVPTVYADRTKNQIAFMKAFYEQHANLKNVTKIPELIDLLNKNVVHSFSLDEILTTYMTLLNEIVSEEYSFETYQIKGRDGRIRGTLHTFLEYESGFGDKDDAEGE
ncbi:MAG: LCP family protein [Oscillospiraceae bacterium]|nr:LCP family protein [Oscillospiraceae bacterium]